MASMGFQPEQTRSMMAMLQQAQDPTARSRTRQAMGASGKQMLRNFVEQEGLDYTSDANYFSGISQNFRSISRGMDTMGQGGTDMWSKFIQGMGATGDSLGAWNDVRKYGRGEGRARLDADGRMVIGEDFTYNKGALSTSAGRGMMETVKDRYLNDQAFRGKFEKARAADKEAGGVLQMRSLLTKSFRNQLESGAVSLDEARH